MYSLFSYHLFYGLSPGYVYSKAKTGRKKNSRSEVVSVLGSEYLSRGGLQLHGSSSYLVFCNYSGVVLKQNISDIKGYKSIVCLVNNLVAFLGG